MLIIKRTIVYTLFYLLVSCGVNHEPIPGPQGQAGLNGILYVIDLCNNGREVLFVLATGEIAAYHSNYGGYLDILSPGTYWTTDGMYCKFIITEDGEVVYD